MIKNGLEGGVFFIKYTQRGSIFLEFQEFLIGTGIPQKNINIPVSQKMGLGQDNSLSYTFYLQIIIFNI